MTAIAKSSYPLDWYVAEQDENDNDIWEAAGGTTDGESLDLYFRIKQALVSNEHVFIEASSPELMADENNPESWKSLEEAQRAMQSWHDENLKEYELEKGESE